LYFEKRKAEGEIKQEKNARQAEHQQQADRKWGWQPLEKVLKE